MPKQKTAPRALKPATGKPATGKPATGKPAKEVAVRAVNVRDSIKLDDLQEFQEEFKSLPETEARKLRASIVKFGFTAPFFIWRKKAGQSKILDGHQRKKVLTQLRADGYSIPPLPVVYIDAKDEQEATRILLTMTSQYGIPEQDRFFALLDMRSINLSDVETEISIPDINLKIPMLVDPDLDPNRNKNDYSLGRKVVRIGDFTGFINPSADKKLDRFITQLEKTGEHFAQTNVIAEKMVRVIMGAWPQIIGN
jgi:hypothetical protein